MSKNNIVIITTRWMNKWKSDDKETMTPIHCSAKAKFVEHSIDSAEKIVDFFKKFPANSFQDRVLPNDKYYSLSDGENSVYLLSCLNKDTPCTNPEEWVRSLVMQFSQPGDSVRMMIHASSDLGSESNTFSSFAGITDREQLNIYAFDHFDAATMILLENTYSLASVPITAEQIVKYTSNLFMDLTSQAEVFKSKWDDYFYGDISIDELCDAYERFMITAPKESDIRGFFFIPMEQFKEKAINLDTEIDDLISRFI